MVPGLLESWGSGSNCSPSQSQIMRKSCAVLCGWATVLGGSGELHTFYLRSTYQGIFMKHDTILGGEASI